MSLIIAKPVLLILTILALTSCSSGKERQEEYYSRAKEHFEQGNFVKANVDIRNALQIDSNYADARYLMALLSEKEKNWQQVLANLKIVIELEPDNLNAHIRLGQLFHLSQVYDHALNHANEALRIEPDNADAYALKAGVYFKEGDQDMAKREAFLALEQDPANPGAISILTEIYKEDDLQEALTIVNSGIAEQSESSLLKLIKIGLLETKNEIDKATEIFQSLIEEHPDNLFFYYRMVTFLEKHKRIDEAEKTLRNIVNIRPDNAKLKMWLVQFLSNQRDLQAAKTTLESFIKNQPEVVELQLALAKVLGQLKDYDGVRSLYTDIIAQYNNSVEALEARNDLIELELSQSNRERGEALLSEIFEQEPENSRALITRAKLSLIDNDVKAAIADLRLAVKNQTRPIEALTLLAKANKMTGANDLALDNYRQLISLDPTHTEALIRASEIQLAAGQIEEAEKWLDSILKHQPDNTEVMHLLVLVYGQQERWQEGFEKAQQLIANSDTKALGYFLQGRLYLGQKEPKSAIESLKEALRIRPKAINGINTLISAYKALDQRQSAINYLSLHVSQYPDHVPAIETLARVVAEEDIPKAIEIYKKAIENQPEWLSLYGGLGRMYAQMNEPEHAVKTIDQGLSINPNDLSLLSLKATQNEKLKQYKEAERLYKQILAIQPKSILASNNLAMLYTGPLENPENLKDALTVISELRAVREPALLDTLGWVNYKLGHNQTAISYLESALEMMQERDGQNNGELHYHLGSAYMTKGDKEQAQQQFELALKSGVNDELKPIVEQNLLQLKVI